MACAVLTLSFPGKVWRQAAVRGRTVKASSTQEGTSLRPVVLCPAQFGTPEAAWIKWEALVPITSMVCDRVRPSVVLMQLRIMKF